MNNKTQMSQALFVLAMLSGNQNALAQTREWSDDGKKAPGNTQFQKTLEMDLKLDRDVEDLEHILGSASELMWSFVKIQFLTNIGLSAEMKAEHTVCSFSQTKSRFANPLVSINDDEDLFYSVQLISVSPKLDLGEREIIATHTMGNDYLASDLVLKLIPSDPQRETLTLTCKKYGLRPREPIHVLVKDILRAFDPKRIRILRSP